MWPFDKMKKKEDGPLVKMLNDIKDGTGDYSLCVKCNGPLGSHIKHHYGKETTSADKNKPSGSYNTFYDFEYKIIPEHIDEDGFWRTGSREIISFKTCDLSYNDCLLNIQKKEDQDNALH